MHRLFNWWFILSAPVAPISPNLQEREKFRKARLLSIILLAVIVITLFVLVGTLIAQELSGVAIILVFFGLINIALVLNRHGFLYIAAAYFLGLYLILATVGIELCVRSVASSSLWAWMAVTIVPIIAGFVLPFWAPLLFASVDILILGEIYTYQFPFGITSLGRADQVDMISFIIFMTGLLAILSSIYAHSVKQGVKALDRTSELESANHELEMTQTQLQHLSITDPLTGICNQRAFYTTADQAILQAQHEHGPVAILFLDGDHFKHINDIHGHAAGDAALRYIAQRIQQTLRAGDLVARYGGEEFIILLPATPIAQACGIAESIRSAIAMESVQENVSITVSIGVAAFPRDGVVLADVIKRADQAMYSAKQQGRNRVCSSADEEQNAHLATVNLLDERHPASNRQMLFHVLIQMLAHHEASLEKHSYAVYEWVEKLAHHCKTPPQECLLITEAALLHDIGKVGIPVSLLLKPEKLTEAEWHVMRQHPVIGESILSDHPAFQPLLPLIRHHHERWDGTGYPDGLRGEAIPLGSRLIAVVDAFAVMTEARSYKEASSVATAMKELQRCAGTQFDPDVIAAFIDIITTAEEQQLAA